MKEICDMKDQLEAVLTRHVYTRSNVTITGDRITCMKSTKIHHLSLFIKRTMILFKVVKLKEPVVKTLRATGSCRMCFLLSFSKRNTNGDLKGTKRYLGYLVTILSLKEFKC